MSYRRKVAIRSLTQQGQKKTCKDKRVFQIPEAMESGVLLHLVSIPACFPSTASPCSTNLLSLACHTEGASC